LRVRQPDVDSGAVPIKRIQSRENAWFKSLQRLAASSRERRAQGRAILDGPHLIAAWQASGAVADALVASESGYARAEARALFDATSARSRVILTDRLFDAVAQVAAPVGIMAIVPTPEPAAVTEQIGDAVLLDGIQDAGNLGSILRSAAAAGVSDVFLSNGTVFAWSPRVLRAGMGAHFSLAIREGVALEALLARCSGGVLVADAHASRLLHESDLRGPVAWIFGNEGAGVSTALAARATRRVRIPMVGKTESLNVAAAAAVCLFEQVRQRGVRRRDARA
jgi:RNA methyltransferase, TrmH family